MSPPFADTLRAVGGLLCVATLAVCGLWSTIIQWKFIEKVHSRLPEAERFKPLFWGPIKKLRLNDEYQRLFPEGHDLQKMRRLMIVAFSAMALRFLTIIITQGH